MRFHVSMQIQPSSGIAVAKRAFPVPLKARCRNGVIVARRGRKSSASQTQVPPMAGYIRPAVPQEGSAGGTGFHEPLRSTRPTSSS